jgi:regulator of replication initiation timing
MSSEVQSKAAMSSRTVKSPAGEDVEVFNHTDFTELCGGNPDRPGQYLMLTSDRLALLRSLWYEGKVVDPSGRAVSILLHRAIKFGGDESGRVRSALLAGVPLLVALERDINGKRTKRVQLVALPEGWLNAIEEWAPRPDPEPEQEPEQSLDDEPATGAVPPVEDPPDDGDVTPPPPPVHVPELQVEIASSVATALLTQVVEIITSGAGDSPMFAMVRAEVSQLEERLGDQMAYTTKLRRQLSELGDELTALKLERDGLRRRIREVEHNLKVATGADAQRIIDAEVRKQLDRVMRSAPVSEKAE